MNILHRYLLRDILFATFAAVAGFGFVLMGGNLIKDAFGKLAAGQLEVAQLGGIMVSVILFVLPYALPFGLLTAVLLVLGRLSAQHEITAMRSAGQSLAQIGAPVLLVAVVGVAGSLVINHVYAPRAKTEYRRLLFDAVQANPVQLIVPGTFVRDIPRVVIFARERTGNEIRDTWAWEMDDQYRLTALTWLERASLHIDEAANELVLTSLGRFIRDLRSERNPEVYRQRSGIAISDAVGTEIRFELGDIFKRKVFEQKPSWMDSAQLLRLQRELESSADPADQRRLFDARLNLHERSSMAFSVLSFALVAIPLGIQTRRKETSANLGLALALILLFYAGIISVGWLDRRPDLRPELLLWAPNLTFQMLGALLWWRFGKN